MNDSYRLRSASDSSPRLYGQKEALQPWLDEVQQHSPSSIWADELLAFQRGQPLQQQQQHSMTANTTSFFSTSYDDELSRDDDKQSTLIMSSLEKQIDEALDATRRGNNSGSSGSEASSTTPTLSPSLAHQARSDSLFHSSSSFLDLSDGRGEIEELEDEGSKNNNNLQFVGGSTTAITDPLQFSGSSKKSFIDAAGDTRTRTRTRTATTRPAATKGQAFPTTQYENHAHRGTPHLPRLAISSSHQQYDQHTQCVKDHSVPATTTASTATNTKSTLYRIPMHQYRDKPLPDSPTSTYSSNSVESSEHGHDHEMELEHEYEREHQLRSYWSDDSGSLDDEMDRTLSQGLGSSFSKKANNNVGGDNFQRILTSWKGLRQRKASVPNLRSKSGSGGGSGTTFPSSITTTTPADHFSISPKMKTITVLPSIKQSESSPSITPSTATPTTTHPFSTTYYSPVTTTKHTSLPKSTLRRLSSFKQRRPSWHETETSKEWSDMRNV